MESCKGCSNTNDEVTELISPYDEDDELEIELPDEDIVNVSYTEQSNLKIVQVLINDRINKEMIFDTGASYTQITVREANYLYNENVLTDDDILGTEKFGDANGNITVNMVVNLRKLVLGGKLILPHSVPAYTLVTCGCLSLYNYVRKQKNLCMQRTDRHVHLFQMQRNIGLSLP